MSQHNSGDILSSFLLGGIIGAALGILFAPESGKKTRKKLNEWLEDTTDDVKVKVEEIEKDLKKKKEQVLKHIN